MKSSKPTHEAIEDATVIGLAQLCQIAKRQGFPGSKTKLLARLRREGCEPVTGEAARGQTGFLFPVASLPEPLRKAVARRAKVAKRKNDAPAANPEFIDRYLAATPKLKAEAERRLAMVNAVRRKLAEGQPKASAFASVGNAFGADASTVKRIFRRVRDADPATWLSVLVPDHSGGRGKAAFPEYELAYARDFGRVEQPCAQAVYERICAQGKREGWGKPPSLKTLQRRFAGYSKGEQVLMRQGNEALRKLYPAQQRCVDDLRPMECWNMDARTWDTMVREGDRVYRPVVTFLQDVKTRLIVGWIVSETESGDVYRRLLQRSFAGTGIPERVLFDNTRAAANKNLTAGAKLRHRFMNDSAFQGILVMIGCEPIFANPYSGQSKPVERAFQEVAERTEKHPDLAGSYTGRSPQHKPANYGAKAVAIATFTERLEDAIEDYNSRIDRRGDVVFGTSCRALFEAGLSTIAVRKLSGKQDRFFFTVAENRTVAADGSITLGKRPYRNRYWTLDLQEHAGRKVTVRFDPDNLYNPVMVLDLNGRLIADEVPNLGKGGFSSRDQAREHNRARIAEGKATKAAMAARIRQLEVEAGRFKPAEPKVAPVKKAKVIAPKFRQVAQPVEQIDPDYQRLALKGMEMMRRARSEEEFRQKAG